MTSPRRGIVRLPQICLSGCRGEHCSPVRFARTIAFLVWLRGRSMTAPTRQYVFLYGFSGRFVGNGLDRPVRFTRQVDLPGWLQRAAYMPPLLRGVFYCPVGRGDPTPPQKPSPWGEAKAAVIPAPAPQPDKRELVTGISH